MNYGLYLSASGVLTNLYRQDVYANNLANVETVGFKPDRPDIRQRAPEAIEGGFSADVSHRLLDQLGGGSFAGPQEVDFSPGPAKQTHGALDVMLSAPDTFFVVSDTGPNGTKETKFTRDGRFQVDAQGFLATATGGHQILGVGDQPIAIDSTQPVHIDAEGHVIQGDGSVGQLQITGVTDVSKLVKTGQNLFGSLDSKDIRATASDARVRPGFLESSAVDPIQSMLKVVDATKAVTTNGNMIRYHDLLMDRAVNVLGRVVA